MKLILVTTLLFITFTGLAQSDWKYEAFYSFDKLSGDNFIGNPDLASFNVHYSVFNYTTGINLQKQIFSRFALRSGLSYSKQEVSKLFNCPVCNTSGDVFPIVNKQRYLQIPFGVSYQVIDHRFSPVIETGLLNNLLVAGEVDDILGNESPSGYYLSGFIGAKLEYQLLEKIGINLSYRFSKSFTDVFESDFTYKTSSLIFGFTYR